MDSRFTDQVSPISVSEAEKFVTQHFGIRNTAHPLGSERDQNFHIRATDGGEFLLKITHPGEALDSTAFQTACLRHVAAVAPSLPVPRVLDDQTGEPHVRSIWSGAERTARMLTFLAGEPLHRGERDAAQRRRIGETLANLDAALATFPGPLPILDIIWDMGRASSIRPLIGTIPGAEQRRMVEARLEAFERRVLPRQVGLPAQPIHNDFNPHNLLVSPQDHRHITGIIDFGDIAVAPRIYDLAVAASYQVLDGEHPLQTASEIVAGYHSVTPLTEMEVALLHDLIPMRLAMAVSITGWRAEMHPENRDYILRNSPGAWRALHQLSRVSPAEAEDYFHAANRRA
ncbi:MAG TPA: phosphotransferase [Acidisoma sp.]|uniref:phosphotransferase n=1 Tax=Acidisoma sp. TaxID=1872115 RepID=UPI002C846D55|nr:phosphotransferase [Acidisoma sp.]HTH99338.1 phosphotransferase [Acidisoma sp.]